MKIVKLPHTLALSLAIGIASCASTPPPQPAGQQAGRQHGESADEWIAAALSASQEKRDPDQALALIRRAVEAAPARSDIAWLQVQLCAAVTACQPESAETRLRKLDPGNAATWIGPLARAQARRDGAAEQQILEAIGRSARFDLYWNSLLWHAAVAMGETAATPKSAAPLTTAINEVTSRLAAVAIPSFQPIATACSAERTREAQHAARCERIAQVLQQGDTYVAEGVGLGIAQRLATPGSKAAAQIAERSETLSYQLDATTEIKAAQLERDKFSAELIELMKKLRREQEVANAVLRWAGLPLAPPAG